MNIVAFTGAGISKASGIPTFEDMGIDIRRKLSRSFFNEHPDEFYGLIKYYMRPVLRQILIPLI
jgi:NAD-dependent SIR2 family protein deacetylase